MDTPRTPTTLERRGGSRVGSGRAVLDRLLEPLADRLADLAAARRPDQLLNGGCGTGSTTVAIARRMGTTAPCVGLDISEPMLSTAPASRFGQRQNRSGGAQATVMNGLSPRNAPDDHSQRAAGSTPSPQKLRRFTVETFLRPVQ